MGMDNEELIPTVKPPGERYRWYRDEGDNAGGLLPAQGSLE